MLADDFGEDPFAPDLTPEERAEHKRKAEEWEQARERQEREHAALEARAVPLRIARLENPDRVKLFHATSRMDGLPHRGERYDGVKVCWTRHGGPDAPPVVPPEEAFLCGEGLALEDVDLDPLQELLTEGDLAELRTALEAQRAKGPEELLPAEGAELEVTEVELPWVVSFHTEPCALGMAWEATSNWFTGSLTVSADDGKPLFHGYYDLEDTGEVRPKPTLQRAVSFCPLCREEFPQEAGFMASPDHYEDRHATPQELANRHFMAPFGLRFDLTMPDGTVRQIDSHTEDPEELALLKALDRAEVERAIGAAIGVPHDGGAP